MRVEREFGEGDTGGNMPHRWAAALGFREEGGIPLDTGNSSGLRKSKKRGKRRKEKHGDKGRNLEITNSINNAA